MSVLISELKDLRAQAVQNMDDMIAQADTAGRDLTADEATRFKGLQAEKDRLTADIERREALETAKADLAKSTRKTEPDQPNPMPVRMQPDIRVIHSTRTLRTFEKHEDAYSAGRWLLAALLDHPKSRQWCLDRGMEFRALSEGVNTAGGFLVPEPMERAIAKWRDAHGIMRANARVMPMTSDTLPVPYWVSGPTASFYGEGEGLTASDVVWGQARVTAKKLGTLTYISSELAEDAVVDIADSLAEDIGYQFALKEDQCGLIGTGAATYGGMVGLNIAMVDGTHEIGSVEIAAGHDLATEVDLPDVMGVIGILPEYALPRAKIYCSGAFKAAIFDRLKGSAGAAELVTGSVAASQFLGYPVVVSNIMPASITTDYTDAVMWLFGDMTKSTLFGDRRGIGVAVDASVRFAYDQIAVRGIERFDIIHPNLGSNTAAGAMVAGVGGT